MTERPILFSGEMVRAILDRRKTQTRRVIKPQPAPLYSKAIDHFEFSEGYWWPTSHSGVVGAWTPIRYCCPYGIPGDRLWVRETWATPGNFDHIKPRDLASSDYSADLTVYRATAKNAEPYYRWRPSIFMTRWAARIELDVVRVQVERVREISEQDAYAEGIDRAPTMPHPRQWFRNLWDRINAKRGYNWDVNPWVWVIEFAAP